MRSVGRFAPTPSGRMHLGNLFSALLAWLSVRSQGGELVLRMEDLDTQRTNAGYASQLRRDGRELLLTDTVIQRLRRRAAGIVSREIRKNGSQPGERRSGQPASLAARQCTQSVPSSDGPISRCSSRGAFWMSSSMS